MSTITATFRGKAVIEASTATSIYNVSAALASTEYSQALSPNTKQFLIRVRGSGKLQLAFTSGQSGVNYITIPAGSTYTQSEINFSGTLYFQTNKAAQVIEILEWT